MRYATCQLSNVRGGFGANATMADYTFMAGTAYLPVNLTQDALDGWFGEGVAVDDQATVDAFREEFDTFNQAVVFKLFTFPSIRLAIICIRGTTTNWDMLADTQLWSAAALMQGIRAILPMGEIWTPILDRKLRRLFCILNVWPVR
jgi:lipase ATG15